MYIIFIERLIKKTFKSCHKEVTGFFNYKPY